MARQKEDVMRALAMLMVFALVAPAAAQPRRGGGPDAQADRRDRIKKRIKALRAYTLIEELSLDDATAAKVIPAIAKYDDELEKLILQRRELEQKLEQAGDVRDSKAVDKLVDDALANQKAFWSIEEKRVADLRKILTPQQTAKLLRVLPAIERRIQNQLRKAALGARGGATRRGTDTVDPFAQDLEDWDGDEAEPPPTTRRPPKARPQDDLAPSPFRKDTPCDPFGSQAGCKR